MFSLLLMGLSTLALTIRSARWRPIAAFASISAGVLIVLLVFGLGPNLPLFLSGAPHRMPVEQFWHGLSISDAIFTFDWVPWVHKHVLNYQTTRPSTLVGEGYHEWPGSLLTIVILASPLVVLLGNLSENKNWRPIFTAAALMTFVLIFAGRGGLGYLVNELINPSLRAQARIMPLVMFLANFVVLAGIQYAWSAPRLLWRAVAVLAILAMATSVWSVRGVLAQRQIATANDPDIQWTITTFKRLDTIKDAAGLKAILQLPVTTWPEAPFRNGYDFYPMRYGFLFDRADSDTKWSYGVSDRQRGFAELSASFDASAGSLGFVDRARKFGYDSILVEKKPYTDAELKNVISAIEEGVPSSCKLFEDGYRSLYDIAHGEECRSEAKLK